MIVIETVAHKKERFVLAVVQLGDHYRSAESRIEVVILKRSSGGHLIEDLTVKPVLIDVAFLGRKMQFVGAALGGEIVRAASGMADFGGYPRGEHLRFLQGIYRGR